MKNNINNQCWIIINFSIHYKDESIKFIILTICQKSSNQLDTYL
ncbi:hypothetical protein pb186bvf_015968 [Paramecium bursaria]